MMPLLLSSGHTAGYQPRGETRVHGETCPPQPTPLANPPVLAVPVSPRQRLTCSSIPAALHSEAAGVKVPQRPAGACQPSKADAHPVARWPRRQGSHRLKLWPLLGTAAPGDGVAGAGKAAPGCAQCCR